MDTIYDLIRPDELAAAHTIETEGFPAGEAATLDAFRYRQANVPHLFLGAYASSSGPRTLVGYIASTQSADATLTHESMSTHVPDGPSVCIHTVCVAASERRKGIALRLLKEYLTRLEARSDVERVLLLCHEELRGLYERAGFEWLGLSDVVHGARPWYEMRKILRVAPSSTISQQIPPGVLEALSAKPTGRPPHRLLSSFPNPHDDIVVDELNKFPLVCLGNGCGSLILLSKTAKFRSAPSVQLDPPTHPTPTQLPALPPPGESTDWWLVEPDMMAFENIGFSRAVPVLGGAPTAPMKLLICAECDLGPVGWSLQGGKQYWVHTSRVGYREV